MYTGKHFWKNFSYSIENGGSAKADAPEARAGAYDVDLLYVECQFCGKPVVWERGRTRSLVKASGLDASFFDEHCLLLSEGCPSCKPGVTHFTLQLVRLASFSSSDFLLLDNHRGHA